MAKGLRDSTPRSTRRPPFDDQYQYPKIRSGEGGKEKNMSERAPQKRRLHEASLPHARRCTHAPFLYSGSPVISSRPSNLHPNIFSIGSTRLYVVHPVSLWKGTSSSPVPSACACAFSASHGQTSPRGTPLRVVRSWGQIGVRPVIRTCQRAARGTQRVAPSAMDSDSR